MRGVCPHTARQPPKTKTEIQEMRFPWLQSKRRDRIPTLGPRAQTNRPKFGHSVPRVGYAQDNQKVNPSRRPNPQYESGFTGNRKLSHRINRFGIGE